MSYLTQVFSPRIYFVNINMFIPTLDPLYLLIMQSHHTIFSQEFSFIKASQP